VAEPDFPHAEGGHHDAALAELVGDPELPPGGLVDGHPDRRRLDRGVDPILQVRLAPGELLQRDLAAFLVQLLEAAVAAVAHDLAGLADAAELLGQLQAPPCRG
jgi:hypothetical protein